MHKSSKEKPESQSFQLNFKKFKERLCHQYVKIEGGKPYLKKYTCLKRKQQKLIIIYKTFVFIKQL